MKNAKNPIFLISFATAFSVFSVAISLLHHGLAHHFPIIALIMWWALYPSVITEKAVEAMFDVTLSGASELFLILIVQFVIGVLVFVFYRKISKNR